MPVKHELLRSIPKVDDLINDERIIKAARGISRGIVVEAIREAADEARNKILRAAESEAGELDDADLVAGIISAIESKNEMSLKRVINATGVILHTNLGRAPLSKDICNKVWEIAENYSTLEYDTGTGERGSRYDHVRELIVKLTGAESAFVVNNNAAAVLLVLSSLVKGRKVVVSRGELVEIGESFRISEIMEQSGAELIEVGATNKTRLSDYLKGIEERGAEAILKIHTSNYRIVGFTEEVGLGDLTKLGKDYELPVIYDLGSGALLDFKNYGLDREATVRESVAAGADIVCFSGDKLLGGPQAGIIAGKKDMIDKMRKNPLTRALRIDKLTLAALEATLRLYLDTEKAIADIPALSMLTMPEDVVKARAERLYKSLAERVKTCSFSLEDGYSQVGGGALPLSELPTKIIAIKPPGPAGRLEEHLRNNRVPIIARIRKDHICLDVRTIRDEDFQTVVGAFEKIIWE